jgi:maleylacetoacetate isomerase
VAGLELHTYFRSSAAYRVRIALNLKGLAYESRFVNLLKGEQRAPEYRRLNPEGRVPALVADGRVLTQSLAIIEYLDEAHPEPPLLPKGLLERAYVRMLAQIVACDIHPLNNLRVLRYLEDPLGHDETARLLWIRHWISDGFQAFEEQLAKHGASGRFCMGETPTLADIGLVPQVYNARRYGCDLAPFPRIRTIEENCRAVPAFQAAAPENQPDASGN